MGVTPRADWVMNVGGLRVAYDRELVVCLRGWHIGLIVGWLEHLGYKTAQEGQWPEAAIEELDDIKGRLMMGTLLDTFWEKLLKIEADIAAIDCGSTGQSVCCDIPKDAVVVQPPISDDLNPYERPIPDALTDIGVTDYDELSAYLCDMGDWIVDSIIDKVNALRELYADGLLVIGAVASVLATVWTGGVVGAVAVAFGTAVAIYDSMQGQADAFFDDMVALVEGVREAVKCAVMGGASPAEVEALVLSVLPSTPAGFVVGLLGWGIITEAVYDAALVNQGYSGTGCVSCDTGYRLVNVDGVLLDGELIVLGGLLRVEAGVRNGVASNSEKAGFSIRSVPVEGQNANNGIGRMVARWVDGGFPVDSGDAFGGNQLTIKLVPFPSSDTSTFLDVGLADLRAGVTLEGHGLYLDGDAFQTLPGRDFYGAARGTLYVRFVSVVAA